MNWLIGNKWYKCDLHLHSTASECFQDKTVTADEWVLACLQKGLDCVALTDHNTGDNIDDYKRVADENGLIFFPGVEITCGDDGTHLLVIFDREATSNTVNDFLISMGIKREKFASSLACSSNSVKKVIEEAAKLGAVVIPAHVDEYNGLSLIRNSFMKDVLESFEINAVQVVQTEFYENMDTSINAKDWLGIQSGISNRYGKGEIELTQLKKWFNCVKEAHSKGLCITTFSDNPHGEGDSKHGLWGIGTRFTHIKMSENPNCKSLQEALLLGDMRVVPDFITFPDIRKELVLEKLIIENTLLNESTISIDFSENLTTIIGGRGTGKSCITRFLLFVLGKEEGLELFPEIASEYRNFVQLEKNGQGVFLKETSVKLELTYLEERYLVCRDINKHNIYQRDESGAYNIIDLERLSMISDKVNLYSQKQIYEISKNQDSIRDILDGYNKENISIIEKEIYETSDKIKQINRDIISLELEVSEKKKVQLSINDVSKQLIKLSSSEYKKINENHRKLNNEREILKSDLLIIQKKPDELSRELISDWFGELPEIDTELTTLRDEMIDEVKKWQEAIKANVGEIKRIIDNYAGKLNTSSWNNEFTENSNKYADLMAKLSADELVMLSNLDKLSEQKKTLEIKFQNIIDKEVILSGKKDELLEVQRTLETNYENLFNERKQFIKLIFEDVYGIDVRISPRRDFDYYISELREVIAKQNTFETEFLNLSERLNKNEITYATICQDILAIKETGSGIGTVFKDAKLINSLASLRDEQLIELQTIVPSDLINISLDVNGKKVNLSNASAGQRTSAILTMILAYGEYPLIMDQPEDDLDSQLINSLIVNSLISKKENRQVIIVTHNANIPVNGDSEWMVCMGNTRKMTVETGGSVDDEEMKTRICDVMEGGKTAFSNRAKRYGFKETILE